MSKRHEQEQKKLLHTIKKNLAIIIFNEKENKLDGCVELKSNKNDDIKGDLTISYTNNGCDKKICYLELTTFTNDNHVSQVMNPKIHKFLEITCEKFTKLIYKLIYKQIIAPLSSWIYNIPCSVDVINQDLWILQKEGPHWAINTNFLEALYPECSYCSQCKPYYHYSTYDQNKFYFNFKFFLRPLDCSKNHCQVLNKIWKSLREIIEKNQKEILNSKSSKKMFQNMFLIYWNYKYLISNSNLPIKVESQMFPNHKKNFFLDSLEKIWKNKFNNKKPKKYHNQKTVLVIFYYDFLPFASKIISSFTIESQSLINSENQKINISNFYKQILLIDIFQKEIYKLNDEKITKCKY